MHRISIFIILSKGEGMEVSSSTCHVSCLPLCLLVYLILPATGSLRALTVRTSQHHSVVLTQVSFPGSLLLQWVMWLGTHGGEGCILFSLYDSTFSSPNLNLTIVLEIVFRFILMMTKLRLKQEYI